LAPPASVELAVNARAGVALAIAVCGLIGGSGFGAADRARTPPPRFRYIYNSDAAAVAAAAAGWNLIDVGSKDAADALPSGTRGLIWVGDYNNSTCSWEIADSTLTSELQRMIGDAKIFGYFISDEPNPYACPNAPTQHRARSDLIHSIDPAKPTVIVLDSNGFTGMGSHDAIDQIPLWKGTATYIGLDPYVCYSWSSTCDYARIDANIRAANRAHLRYWGVVQAFNDGSWRWPTASEARHMLRQWSRSRESGYMVFAWRWAGRSLVSRPGLLGVLKRFNRGAVPRRPALTRKLGASAAAADEIHYTFTGPTSVAVDWRGSARTIRYGRTRRYGKVARAHAAVPTPYSSAGPFWEVRIGGLRRGAVYHYSIAGGADNTFSTPPKGPFRFDVEADVGDSQTDSQVLATQKQIAADKPAFVIVAGDLTYANDDGQRAADQHFNDVQAWSRRAAYMPAWGNHEWDSSGDDLRNYKGRFAIPHAQASPGAPAAGCCGEDWSWFDAGGVRFISYPEPYARATWLDWQSKADRLMNAAQADPQIHFIVTFGHRPAYSSGYHSGDSSLAAIMNSLGDKYSKYVLNLNGHSHDYERFAPIHHVVHITAAGGGAELEPWKAKDSRSVFRMLHLEHVRVDVSATRIRIQALCGPATSHDDGTCRLGQPIDTYTITR
jgi:Calcineurin-like phosphoesterase